MTNILLNRSPIRSFVRRLGRISARQQRALTDEWDKYVLALPTQPYEWSKIFGIENPTSPYSLTVEIGFGMGQSLALMAKEHPDQFFIGIEVHRPGVGALLAQIVDLNLKNIRIFCEDALTVLPRALATNSIDKLQIYFPDPWPKRRHQKRRLINDSFVNYINPFIKAGGIIHLATDWQEYGEQMLTVFSAHKDYKNLAGPHQFCERVSSRPLTKFEKRGQNLGHLIWELQFSKVNLI